jgi:hypothetical protein
MKRKYFAREEWRQRVNPVFVKYWNASKRFHAVDINDRKKWKKAFNEMGAASRLLAEEESKIQNPRFTRVWREILRPLDGEVWPGGGEAGKGYAVNPESSAFFRDLVFLILGVTFRELIVQLERDPGRYPKLLKVHRAYYRFRAGKTSFRDLKLKFHFDHFSIMVQGLDFGLGGLNESELAACFDEICPCGRYRHSVGFLTKFRTSVKQACERLRESMNKPTSFETPKTHRTVPE